MAVYERLYKPFEGELTPEASRFLVLPRYAYQQVFRSRLFAAFLIAWLFWSLILAIVIYVPHNISLLEKLGMTTEELGFLPVFHHDAGWFFNGFMIPAGLVGFEFALVVGPALISGDLRNNGLPLYLGRPFSRTEYILGKFAVLAVLMSAVSWVPGLMLFFLRAYFGGWSWFADNLRIGVAIFVGCWVGIVLLSVLSLALSAYLKWRPVAGMALLAVVFLSPIPAAFLNFMLKTYWASVINISDMVRVVWAGLFGIENTVGVPAVAAWLSLLTVCGLSLMLLYRKVRAYEVVH